MSDLPESSTVPPAVSSHGDATNDTEHIPPVVHGWKRVGFLVVAAVFFVLGVAGAILPVLPATPFLLLTSYFLVRSSPRLNRRLLKSRLLGPILVDWQVRRGVRRHIKVKAVVIVIATIALTVVLSGYSPVTTAVVIALASIGIFVIWRLPSVEN